MQVVTSIKSLQQVIKQFRQQGETVALVPTMGNLHDGHLRLVSEAKSLVDRVVISIFVNPSQFGEGEDYAEYPRTEKADREKLTAMNTDLLFSPEVGEIYPPGAKTVILLGDLSDQYCGASRPGHFNGVATIVCKLLNMVQPDTAIFGEKDWQQLIVIRRMVNDLNMPVQIHGVPIVREADGLAMSSRNGYLSAQQRVAAVALFYALCEARDAINEGQMDFNEIEKTQLKKLQQSGFFPDYFSICRSDDLKTASRSDNSLVILAAAKLGKTRLIDNIQVTRMS